MGLPIPPRALFKELLERNTGLGPATLCASNAFRAALALPSELIPLYGRDEDLHLIFTT